MSVDDVDLIGDSGSRDEPDAGQIVRGVNSAALIDVHMSVDDVDLVTSAPLEQRGVGEIIVGSDATALIHVHAAVDDVHDLEGGVPVFVDNQEDVAEVVGGS